MNDLPRPADSPTISSPAPFRGRLERTLLNLAKGRGLSPRDVEDMLSRNDTFQRLSEQARGAGWDTWPDAMVREWAEVLIALYCDRLGMPEGASVS